MPHGKAEPIALSPAERCTLDRLIGSAARQHGMARRAAIVVLAAQGLSNRTISDRLQLEEHCVGRWRRRFVRHGLWGLFDRPRTGRPAMRRAEPGPVDQAD